MLRDIDRAREVLNDTYSVFGIGDKILHPELRDYLEQRIAAEIRTEQSESLPSAPFKVASNRAVSHALSLVRGRVATLELRMDEVQKELEEKRNQLARPSIEGGLRSSLTEANDRYKRLESVAISVFEAIRSLDLAGSLEEALSEEAYKVFTAIQERLSEVLYEEDKQ